MNNYLFALIAVALLVVGLFGGFALDNPNKDLESDLVAANLRADNAVADFDKLSLSLVPVPSNETVFDIEAAFANLPEVRDDVWETEAEEIATTEWSENDNRDLFRAIDDIYGDLRDKDDIIYVKEDDSTDFSRMDDEDRDGFVTQYLKVKYEDENGDDRKVYLTIETEIDDGDIEEQTFEETA